jgi:tetratricopeptide (TPR) repeat protein
LIMESLKPFTSQNMRSAFAAVAMLLAPLPAFAVSRQEVCQNTGNVFPSAQQIEACNDMLKVKLSSANRALVYFFRASAKRALQKNGEAIEDYNESLKTDPKSDAAYNNRGSTKTAIGDYEGALLDFNAALKLKPYNALAYHNRGLLRLNAKDNKAAIDDFDQAIKFDANNAVFYGNRGLAKYRSDDYQAAIADLDSAIKLDPQFANSYTNRGLAKIRIRDNQGAVADLTMVIKLTPDASLAYSYRGNAKNALDDYAGAIADYNRAIELARDNVAKSAVYYDLGFVFDKIKQFDDAITAFSMAITLNPKNSDAIGSRGWVRFEKGDMAGAITDCDQAIALKSDDVNAHINRGLAQVALGAFEKARNDYKTVMSLNHQPDEDLTKLERLLAEHDAGDKPAQAFVVAAPTASAPVAVAPVVAALPPAVAAPAIAAVAPAGPLKGHYALVIGDDKYQNFPAEQQLDNAYSDASSIGDALKDIGYEVMRGQNLTRQGMVDKLSAFTSQLHDGDTALFFFAGHGVSIEGANYLVPTDMPRVSVDSKGVVTGNSIKESEVVDQIQDKKVRIAVLILDACRDNPFSVAGTRAVLGNTRGLSDAKPARGVFEIYSAGIGQSALDNLGPGDKNPNSVFTRVLVQTMRQNPDMDLPSLAVNVREEVAGLAASINHEQTPAYYDQTIGGRVSLRRLELRRGR